MTTLLTMKWFNKKIDYLCFTANTAGSTVRLNYAWNPTIVNLEISTDWITRTDYTINNRLWTIITLSSIWDKVYFRNKSETVTWFSTSAWSDYSRVTKTISGWEVELWLRTIVNVPTSNFTLTAPATLKDWEEYAIRIISETSYTMTLWTWFTNPRNVDTTLSWNATDQYVFLSIGWELELQPLVN